MPVFIFDPTSSDKASAVRGVGRYLQILKENCSNFCTFVNDLSPVPAESILINPFVNLIGEPLLTKRIANTQIGVIHDLIPLQYPEHFPVGLKGRIKIWNNKRLLSLYDHFVTDSETSKKQIIKILQISPEKISVVYPTLAASFWKEEKLVKPQGAPEVYCLYVGDATWNKNIVTMAQAIIESKIPCICIGKIFSEVKNLSKIKQSPHPWQDELWQFSKLTSNYPLFIFPGYIDDEMLRAYYQHALVNLLISKDEGFGFSYLEASSQYCPSILSETQISKEISSGAGYFVKLDDIYQISQTIQAIKSDQNTRQVKIQAAHERSLFFSPSQFINDVKMLVTAT